MKAGGRTFLLALIGALAEFASFAIAARWENTLRHPGIPATDPRFRFTYGTQWGMINHWAAGFLLCGGITFVLVADRKGLKWAAFSGLLAAAIGGVAGALADSGSDLLGIALERRFGNVPFLPEGIWSLIVPAAYALVITVCIGMTVERLKRAIYATVLACVWSFIAAAGAELIISALVASGTIPFNPALTMQEGTPADGGLALMKASVPIWCASATAVGFFLGAVFGRAETKFRSASLLMVMGRNEGKQWNLDHAVNRIGSREGVEILIRNAGAAALHASIVRHPNGFAIEDMGPGVLLNGQPLQGAAWLNNSDTIGIGQAALVFQAKRSARAAGYPAFGLIAPPGGQATGQPGGAAQWPSLVDAFGNSYMLHQGSNVIGRETGCQVCIHWDDSVSRRHAEIVLIGTSAQVRELGSSNGTWLNGRPLSSAAELRPGDVVQFGNVALSFQA